MAYFQAGLVLEEAVSRGLRELGIVHRRTEAWGTEDVHEAIDFFITAHRGRPAFEVQLTLRPKHEHKRLAFTLAALRTRARGIRLYLEVVGSRRKDDLVRIGKKVARAIQTVVKHFRNLDPYNLMGVIVNARNGAIEKFDLVRELGSRLTEAARRLLEELAAAREAQATATASPASRLIHLGLEAFRRMHTLHLEHQRAPARANRFPTRRPFIPPRHY